MADDTVVQTTTTATEVVTAPNGDVAVAVTETVETATVEPMA